MSFCNGMSITDNELLRLTKIFALLHQRTAPTRLVMVKAHRGHPLNEAAGGGSVKPQRRGQQVMTTLRIIQHQPHEGSADSTVTYSADRGQRTDT